MTAKAKKPDSKPDIVESPCTGVCKLDDDGKYCTGCLRTRFEIGVWSRAIEAEKRAILERIARL
ncbi:DUF1289 domain-containing protein [Kordiimonas sp.]|uniref:DUF1289 domain-containing protein n=1 Tax=Kordiimonas sp. TaxID=1970157 RepID=UPI003A95D62C